MASTNSNKGRAVVLSAACVTMFFISSIALYSVVSKNLLAVYPELGGCHRALRCLLVL